MFFKQYNELLVGGLVKVIMQEEHYHSTQYAAENKAIKNIVTFRDVEVVHFKLHNLHDMH